MHGVYVALEYGQPKLMSDTIKPYYDEEIDGIRINKVNDFNKNGETYVNLFKRHKEEQENRQANQG